MFSRILLAMFLIFIPHLASAFPIYYRPGPVSPLLGQEQRKILALSFHQELKAFVPVRFAVDEIESDAFLVLRQPKHVFPHRKDVAHPAEKDPFSGHLTKYHRLVFNDTELSICDSKCLMEKDAKLPTFCKGYGGFSKYLLTLFDNASGGTLFLVACNQEIPSRPIDIPPFVPSARAITFPLYKAILHKESPFLLDRLLLSDGDVAFENFDFKATLTSKMLLSFTFGKSDLRGEVVSASVNSLAESLEIATPSLGAGFFAKKQVCCDITFYEDAFYLPIYLQIPRYIEAINKSGLVEIKFNSQIAMKPIDSPRDSPYLFFERNGIYFALGIEALGLSHSQAHQASFPKNSPPFSVVVEKQRYTLKMNQAGTHDNPYKELWIFLSKNYNSLKNRIENGLQLQRVD